MSTPSTAVAAPLRYPLSLGLLDFAPVLLTALGQWLLLDAAAHAFRYVWPVAVCGALMMFAGGFLKATWKTVIAATARDIRWMEHALFPLLAPGAALFAWAAWQARGEGHGGGAGWSVLYPVVISTALLAASLVRLGRTRKWFLPLVALLTVSMGVIAASAGLMAWHTGRPLAASLFVASFAVSLITAALARRTATIEAQWVMEFANTGAALLFLLGAVQMGAHAPGEVS